MTKMQIALATLALIWGTAANASTKSFTFHFNGGDLKITEEASDWEEAYKRAAHSCFNHYTGSTGKNKAKINRDFALEVIDVCANPRKG